MRYDTKVVFVEVSEPIYDPTLGKTIQLEISTTEVHANVSDLSPARSMTLFGDVFEKRKVIRLLHHYDTPWGRVIIDGRTYRYETSLDFRQKQAIIVKEVRDAV